MKKCPLFLMSTSAYRLIDWKNFVQNLVRVRAKEGLGVFAGAKTVETIDNNTQVVAQTWKATGILSG
jgi:hypothetical protein